MDFDSFLEKIKKEIAQSIQESQKSMMEQWEEPLQKIWEEARQIKIKSKKERDGSNKG